MSLSKIYYFICLITVIYFAINNIKILFNVRNINLKLLWRILTACLVAISIHLFFAMITPAHIWEVMKNENARVQGLGSYAYSAEATYIFFTRLAIIPLVVLISNRDEKMSLQRIRYLLFQFVLSIVIIT